MFGWSEEAGRSSCFAFTDSKSGLPSHGPRAQTGSPPSRSVLRLGSLARSRGRERRLLRAPGLPLCRVLNNAE